MFGFALTNMSGFGAGSQSEFSPLSLSPKVWYRSDLGITVATGVSQWVDQSGNGHHLIQGTGANQPAYNATSGANSLPGLTFDGSNDKLECTFSSYGQPFHGFAILKTTTVSGVVAHIAGASSNERFHDCQGGCLVYFGASGITRSPTHSDTTNFYLWEYLINNASSSVIRGNASATAGTVGTTALTGITLGQLPGFGYAAGVLSEFMVLPVQSGAGLTALRAYFAARYGVTTL